MFSGQGKSEVLFKSKLPLFSSYTKDKHPNSRVEVLPMDLSSGEESLKEHVHEAESLFSNAGIDYMIHNAAFERPVSIIKLISSCFLNPFKSMAHIFSGSICFILSAF